MKSIFNFDCIKDPDGKSDFQNHNKYTIALPWHPSFPFTNRKKAVKFQTEYAVMCTKAFLEMMDIFNQLSQVYNRNLPKILANPRIINVHADTAYHAYYDMHSAIDKFIVGYKRRENKPEGTFYVGNTIIDLCSKLQGFIVSLNKDLQLSHEEDFFALKNEQLETLIKLVFCFGMDDAKKPLDVTVALRTASKEALLKTFFPWKE